MKKILIFYFMFLFVSMFCSAELLHLDDSNFTESTQGKLFIIDFYADWCGPCMAFAPAFEAVAAKLPSGNFAKVNVDNAPNISTDFGIQFIPYIVAVKDGKVIEQFEGNRTEEIFSGWCSSVFNNNSGNDSISSENVTWSGNWITYWDSGKNKINMELIEANDKIIGTYEWNNGVINGTSQVVNGISTFNATWTQTKSKGWTILTLSADGNSFSGEWGYEGKKKGGMWYGERGVRNVSMRSVSLPESMKVWVDESKFLVVNQYYPDLIERELKMANHFTGQPACYVAVYSHNKEGSIYKVDKNIFVMGLIRVEGEFDNRMIAQPKGYEGKDISKEKYFKDLANKYFPACKGEGWVGGDTGGFICSFK